MSSTTFLIVLCKVFNSALVGSSFVTPSGVEAAAGPRLRALHDAVKPQAERYERLYVSLLSRGLAPSVQEHAAIIRAIRGGDPDQSQRAVQTNWRNAATRLGQVITHVGERGQW